MEALWEFAPVLREGNQLGLASRGKAVPLQKCETGIIEGILDSGNRTLEAAIGNALEELSYKFGNRFEFSANQIATSRNGQEVVIHLDRTSETFYHLRDLLLDLRWNASLFRRPQGSGAVASELEPELEPELEELELKPKPKPELKLELNLTDRWKQQPKRSPKRQPRQSDPDFNGTN